MSSTGQSRETPPLPVLPVLIVFSALYLLSSRVEVNTHVSEVKTLLNCEILNESLNLPRLTW